MAGHIEMTGERSNLWRVAMWGGAAALLTIPAIAMQFTREVSWGPVDFITMGTMLALVCAGFELAVRLTHSPARRLVAGLAILTIFLLVWVELAVGIFD